MATDVERLVVSLEASITKYTKALQKASGDADTQAGKIERRFRSMSEKIDTDAARSMNSLQAQTGNIAAQFQDIGVQLAGGQSPFLIALQQGSQLGAVLGSAGGGLRGTVSALGAAFASMASPVNIATIGLIALGGAAVQYFTSTEEEIVKTDVLLRQHGDAIKALAEAYGLASEGVAKYTEATRAVVVANLAAETEKLQARLSEIFSTVEGEVGNFTRGGFQVQGIFVPLADEIRAFRDEVAAGTGDFVAFDQQMAEIANNTAMPANVRDAAQAVRELIAEAVQVQGSLNQAAAGMDAAGNAAVLNAGKVRAFSAALRDMATAKSAAAVEANFERMAGNAQSYGEVLNAVKQRQDALNQLQRTELEKNPGPVPAVDPRKNLGNDAVTGEAVQVRSGGGRSGGGGSTKADTSYTDAVKRIQERTQAYLMEAQAIAAFGGNVDQARTYVDLLLDAQAQGIPITDALKGSISELAGQYAVAGDAAQQAAEAQREMERAAEEFADLGRDMLGGFIQDLRSGKSAAEALANALDKVADKLLNSALDGLFGGGGGGLFAGLFGSSLPASGFSSGIPLFSAGGYTGAGGKHEPAGVVHKGEYVVNAEATRRNRALLEALNAGLPGYATGGFVRPAAAVGIAARMVPTSGGPSSIAVNVAGARGDRDIQRMVAQGVQEGLRQYDAALPSRIRDKQAKSML